MPSAVFTPAYMELLEERRLLSSGLTVTFIPPAKPPAIILPGSKQTAKFEIASSETQKTSLPITVYVSDQAALDSTDSNQQTILTINSPLQLKAGKSKNITVHFTMPASFVTGTSYILISTNQQVFSTSAMYNPSAGYNTVPYGILPTPSNDASDYLDSGTWTANGQTNPFSVNIRSLSDGSVYGDVLASGNFGQISLSNLPAHITKKGRFSIHAANVTNYTIYPPGSSSSGTSGGSDSGSGGSDGTSGPSPNELVNFSISGQINPGNITGSIHLTSIKPKSTSGTNGSTTNNQATEPTASQSTGSSSNYTPIVGAGSFSVTPPAPSVSGNTPTPTPASVTIDQTQNIYTNSSAATTLTGTYSDANATSSAVTITITGNGQTLDIPATVDTINDTWSTSVSTANLPNGVYNITAVATDLAGNSSTGTTPAQLVVDTIAPVVTIDQTQTIYVNSGTTITGTYTDANINPNGIVVTINDGSGDTQNFPATVDAANNTWSAAVSTTNLPNGDYSITAVATDLAGNVSAPATTPAELVVEHSIDISQLPATAGADFTLTGDYPTPSYVGTITVTLTNSQGNSLAPFTTYTVNTAAGTWSAQIPIANVPDGTYTVNVTDTNTGASIPVPDSGGSITISTIGSNVHFDPSQLPLVTNADQTLTGTYDPTDADGGQITSITVNLTTTNSSGTQTSTPFAATLSDGTWSAPISITGVADGTYTVTAVATDSAGNTGAAGAPGTFTLDTLVTNLASDVTIATPGPWMATPNTPFTLTGAYTNTQTGPDGNPDFITAITINLTDSLGNTNSFPAIVNNSGTWSALINVSSLAAGTYTVSATISDSNGSTVNAPANGTFTVLGLSPAEMRGAYGLGQIGSSPITFNGTQGDGSGETIAIVDAYDDPNAQSDLEAFDQQFGLPNPPSFEKLDQNGQTVTTTNPVPTEPAGDDWTSEESLDIEWAHAMAPDANIILFEAAPATDSLADQFAALLAATQSAAKTPGVNVVSMSWGFAESLVTNETQYDSIFATPGVTFVASTGDNGASSQQTDYPSIEYPAASPDVVAVGGTVLTTNGNTYSGETAWSGSGGGVSVYEGQPSYQASIVTQSSTQRTVPDVSMDAAPITGVPIYDSFDNPGDPWLIDPEGGTSLAAPMFAAIVAVADQGRASNGLGSLSSTQTLQQLYAAAGTSDFHDVTTGNNGYYSASPGYDLVTGLGSPVANLLIPELAGASAGAPTAPTLTINQTQTIYTNSSTTISGTYTGTDVNNLTVTLDNGNGHTKNIAATLDAADDTWSAAISATGLPDGTYSITATATNTAGGSSQATTPAQLVVDTIAPVITIDQTQNIYTNSGTTITGTYSDANINPTSIVVTINDGNGDTQNFPATVDTANDTWSAAVSTTNLPNGDYSITAVATDLAGNHSATAMTPAQLVVEHSIDISQLPATAGADFTLTGDYPTPPYVGTITVTLTNAQGNSLAPFTTYTVNTAAGTWSAQIPIAGVPDGTYTVTATDTNGGTGSITTIHGSGPLTISTIGSNVHFNSTQLPLVTNANPTTLTGTYDATDADGSQITGITVYLTNSSGTQTSFPATLSDGTWSAPVDISGLTDGAYIVTATATDSNGNTGAAGAPGNFTIDTLVNTLGSDVAFATTSDAEQLITLESGVSDFTLTLQGQTTTDITNGGTPSDLANTITTDLEALSNIGTGNISVLAESSTQFLVTFTGTLAGKAEPTMSSSDPAGVLVQTVQSGANQWPFVTSTNITLNGTYTDPDGQTGLDGNTDVITGITINLIDSQGNVKFFPATLIDGNWFATVEASELADATYIVTATVADSNGNTGVATAPGTFTVYTSGSAGPALTIDQTTPIYVNPNASTTITGTYTDADINPNGISVTIDDGHGDTKTFPATVNTSNDTWSAVVAPADLPEGVYSITASASDLAGNSSTKFAAAQLVVDNTAEAVTINMSALPATVGADFTLTGNYPAPPYVGTIVVTLTNSQGGSIAPFNVYTVNTGSGTWSAPISIAGVPDGTYTVTAANINTDGTTVIGTGLLTISTIGSNVHFNSSQLPIVTNTDQFLTGIYDATDADGGQITSITVYLTDSSGTQTSFTAVLNSTNHTWIAPINIANLADGAYTVTATATDSAGNTGTAGAPGNFTIDTLVNTLGSDVQFNNPNDAEQQITLGGADNFTLTFDGQTTSQITYDPTADTMAGNIASALEALGNIGSGNITVVAESNMQYLVTFVGAMAGQPEPTMVSSDPNATVLTVQSGYPWPIVTASNLIMGGTFTNPDSQGGPDGNSDSITAIIINLTDSQGNVKSFAATLDDGAWSALINVSSLTDGTYTVTATVFDSNGNTGTAVAPGTFTIN